MLSNMLPERRLVHELATAHGTVEGFRRLGVDTHVFLERVGGLEGFITVGALEALRAAAAVLELLVDLDGAMVGGLVVAARLRTRVQLPLVELKVLAHNKPANRKFDI